MSISLTDILPIEIPKEYKLHLACWNREKRPLDVFVADRAEWLGLAGTSGEVQRTTGPGPGFCRSSSSTRRPTGGYLAAPSTLWKDVATVTSCGQTTDLRNMSAGSLPLSSGRRECVDGPSTWSRICHDLPSRRSCRTCIRERAFRGFSFAAAAITSDSPSRVCGVRRPHCAHDVQDCVWYRHVHPRRGGKILDSRCNRQECRA